MRIWRRGSINRSYVSELGRFLAEFDKRPEASSASRRAEEAQYAELNRLRDDPKAVQPKIQIWEGI